LKRIFDYSFTYCVKLKPVCTNLKIYDSSSACAPETISEISVVIAL